MKRDHFGTADFSRWEDWAHFDRERLPFLVEVPVGARCPRVVVLDLVPRISPRFRRPDHLYEGTQAENAADRDRDGTTARGASNGKTKVSVEQVQEMRRLFAEGCLQKDIAIAFGLDASWVSRVVRGVFR